MTILRIFIQLCKKPLFAQHNVREVRCTKAPSQRLKFGKSPKFMILMFRCVRYMLTICKQICFCLLRLFCFQSLSLCRDHHKCLIRISIMGGAIMQLAHIFTFSPVRRKKERCLQHVVFGHFRGINAPRLLPTLQQANLMVFTSKTLKYRMIRSCCTV